MAGGDSSIELIHGLFDAHLHPALDRFAHRIEQVLDDSPLLGGELIQHIISKILEADGWGADTDPEPSVILALQRAFHAAETVVPSGRAGSSQAETAERQRDVIHQNQKLCTGIEIRTVSKRS